MSFNFSQTAGTSGITTITVSATSREELTNYVENYTLANQTKALLMPIAQRAYEPLEKYIIFQPSAITWSNSGGTASLNIQSNDEWFVVADEWIEITRYEEADRSVQTVSGSGNATIGLRCYENIGSARTGTISGYCKSNSAISATTVVEQSGNFVKPYLTLGQYQYNVEESGYTGCSISVASNLDWITITDARWIDINTVSGSNNGTIVFDVQHNEQSVNRIGTITVSSTTESLSAVCIVLQSATTIVPYLIVTPSGTTVPISGGDFTLAVSSNTSWETSVDYGGDSRSWISLSYLNGSGDTNVVVRVDQYSGQNSGRSATISFFNDLYGLKVDTLVEQKDKVKPTPSTTKLYYTSTDGNIVSPRRTTNSWGNNVNVVSNTYEDGLGTIEFDGVVTNIPQTIFTGRTTLETVILPSSAVVINVSAFTNCSALTEITYPCKNISTNSNQIGQNAFSGCSSLENVYFIGDNADIYYWMAVDQFYSFDNGYALYLQDSLLYDVDLSGYESNVPDEAFVFCKSITAATIGKNQYSHGISLGKRSFKDCSNLKALTLYGSVRTIDTNAFKNCTSLNEIYCYGTTPPTLNSEYGVYPFDNISPTGTLHYPKDKDYSTFISRLPNGWTAIDDI